MISRSFTVKYINCIVELPIIAPAWVAEYEPHTDFVKRYRWMLFRSATTLHFSMQAYYLRYQHWLNWNRILMDGNEFCHFWWHQIFSLHFIFKFTCTNIKMCIVLLASNFSIWVSGNISKTDSQSFKEVNFICSFVRWAVKTVSVGCSFSFSSPWCTIAFTRHWFTPAAPVFFLLCWRWVC